MRNASLAIVVLCCLLPSSARRAAPPNLAWLAGHWSGEAWGGEFQANYLISERGMVLSYSKLIKDGRDVYYEFEVFEVEGDGIRLSPYPGGKPADGFLLTAHDARRAVFENPEKDYPTRMIYERVEDDRLVITLDDPHGDSGKREVFDLALVHDD